MDSNLISKVDRRQYIVYALLAVSFFFPVSQGGLFLQSRYFIMFFIFLICNALFIKITPRNLIFFLSINISLIVFTIAASLWFNEYSFGIYPNFFFLSMLLVLNYTDLDTTRYIYTVQLIATWCIIILGIGIVIGNTGISQFVINNYSVAYDELLPNMLAARKPVATFGTHSVASFLLFFLVYMNIKTYKVRPKLIYLITSIVLVLLLIFVRSNAALAYSGISFVLLFRMFAKKKSSLFIGLGIVVAIFLYVGLIDPSIVDVFSEYDVLKILTSSDNGLAGRYSGNSVLAPTIDYIKHNPLVPLGLAYSDKLYYSDSGIILYMLRGSIILVLAIYLGFYSFLKDNLLNNRNAIYIFFFFMVIEIGFPALIAPQVLCFIPFLIVYLNHLSKETIVER